MAISFPFGATLATSTPLDLGQGFPLFNSGSFLPENVGFNYDLPFFVDIHPPPIGIGLRGSFTGSLFAGVVGPSFATTFTLEGKVDNSGQVNFTVPSDVTQAGFIFGVTLNFNLDLTAAFWFIDKARRPASATFSGSLDLLQLMLGILVKAADHKHLTRATNHFPQLYSSYGLYDEQSDMLQSQGRVELYPYLNFPFNLEPLLVLLPDVGPDVKAFNDALDELGGGLGFGPIFSVGIEVSVALQSMAGFGLSDNLLNYTPGVGYSTHLSGSTGAPLEQLTFIVENQTPRVAFGLGAFANLTLAEGFNLGVTLGPYRLGTTALSTTPHQHVLMGRVDDPVALEEWEVVFG